MICKNCGKEIPDTALFCGWCGAKQKEDVEEKEPVDVQPAPVQEEVKPEEHVSETETETESGQAEQNEPEEQVIDVETEESPAGEEIKEEKKDPSISERIRNSEAGKKVLGEDGKFTKEDFSRISGTAADRIRTTAGRIDWKEFRAFLEILKDPFSDHELALVPTITALVVMLALNWFIFGSFASGLIVLLLVCAGSIAIQYAGRGREHFSFMQAVSAAVQTAFIPFLALFTAALLGGVSLFHGDLPQIQSELALLSILVVFAVVMLTIGLIRSAGKINSWKGALIITVTYALIAYYLLSQLVSGLYTLM